MNVKLNLNKNKGYLLFHINTSFSSIEKDQINKLLEKCYWPLLHMIKSLNIKTAIEISGKSLLDISLVDPKWVSEFKILNKKGLLELVGSGYCQIIGPLVPYELNLKNQILGIEQYKSILGIIPKIALVNEMSFSSGVVDFYYDSGYEAIIMERNNIALAKNKDLRHVEEIKYARGTNTNRIKLLWSDSILFQRFQRYAHGEISLDEYLENLSLYKNKFNINLPIYSNDAEVFNYRPGRFKDESLTKGLDEWKRIQLLIKQLMKNGLIFKKPSELIIDSIYKGGSAKKLNSCSYPAPVKKQPKYNLSRWALSGRDDVWINTICHRILKKISKDYKNRDDYWIQLCELWSSDLRTHITYKRWKATKNKIIRLCKEINVSSSYEQYKCSKSLLIDNKNLFSGKVINDKDSNFVNIKTKFLKLELNKKKGLAINSLSFKKHKYNKFIGSIPATNYENIEYGADFFSGGLLLEVPVDRRRYTDYFICEPKIRYSKNTLFVSTKINIGFATIEKLITIYDDKEKIKLNYRFLDWKKKNALIRFGNFIFTHNNIKNFSYESFTGGKKFEKFSLKKDFDHSEAVSSLVSSKTCIPANSGEIVIGDNKDKVKFKWSNEEAAIMPLIVNKKMEPLNFLRLIFSLSEIDDTSKPKDTVSNISLSIIAVQ